MFHDRIQRQVLVRLRKGDPWYFSRFARSSMIMLHHIATFAFRIESTSATGTVTVHAEGGINRSPLRGEAPVDLLIFPCLTMVGLCDMVWRCLKNATVSEGKVSVVFWNIHTRNASWVRCWIDRCWMFNGDRMEARIGSGFVSAKFWWCIISSSLEWLFSSPRISLSLFIHTPKWRPAVLGRKLKRTTLPKRIRWMSQNFGRASMRWCQPRTAALRGNKPPAWGPEGYTIWRFLKSKSLIRPF